MKYLLAYSLPFIAFIGIFFGGFLTYSGVVFAFGIIPVLELILPTDEKNYNEADIENKLKNHFFDVLLYLNIFIVYGMLFFVLHKVSTEHLSFSEIIGTVLSLGVVLGSNGINVAHELGHREKLYERIIGKLLLIPSHYTHFFIEHNHGHHLHVSTPEDPSTAKYNQTLYAFWIQTVFGTYTKAWKIQKKLNQIENRSFFSLKKNVSNLADSLNKDISSLTACVMDRPRHKKIIDELKQLNINIKLITDGDVLGALYVTDPKYNVDIFLGIGGGPEGVLAASALDAFGCHFQGRFIFDNQKDIKDAKDIIQQKYTSISLGNVKSGIYFIR